MHSKELVVDLNALMPRWWLVAYLTGSWCYLAVMGRVDESQVKRLQGKVRKSNNDRLTVWSMKSLKPVTRLPNQQCARASCTTRAYGRRVKRWTRMRCAAVAVGGLCRGALRIIRFVHELLGESSYPSLNNLTVSLSLTLCDADLGLD